MTIIKWLAITLCFLFSQSTLAVTTYQLTPVSVGGFGGNQKIGKLSYSNLYYPLLEMSRDDHTQTCYFQNKYVRLINSNTNAPVSFQCVTPDPYNHTYWDGEFESVKGGYSPANDALYGGTLVSKMIESWYGLPVVHDADNKQIRIDFSIYHWSDSIWFDENRVIVTNGDNGHYPLSSVDWIAAQMAELFTKQHSAIEWGYTQSGGIEIAFDLMTSVAAHYFADGSSQWAFGLDEDKGNEAFFYLDQPSKTCHGKDPGDWCPIDSADQYQSMFPTFAAGPFTRAFYLIATSPGWNIRKAYNIMVQANLLYWKPDTNYQQGACDVMHAARDYKYSTSDVAKAFKAVAIDVSGC